jgi:hypothetical protein
MRRSIRHPAAPLAASRRGFALFIALGSLIVIGALIIAVFYSSTQEFRVGRNSLVQETALAAAEQGQNKLVSNWQLSYNNMRNGDTVAMVDTVDASTSSYATVRMTKLNAQTYQIESVGSSGSTPRAQAQRRTGLLIRIDMPNMPFPGAITTDSSFVVGGSSTIHGTDAAPAAWTDCPPTSVAHAGVATNQSTNTSTSGTNCTSYSCVTGSPQVLTTPIAKDTNAYYNYGDFTWTSLVASADRTLAAGSSVSVMAPAYNADGSCNKTLASNFGDVNRNAVTPGKCESFFPIVYAAGNLTVSNGSGQGMLLVQGNLDISGQFVWYGPIVVRGTLNVSGVGTHIYGGVMVDNTGCVIKNPATTCSSVLGTADIQYSSCAINQVFKSRVYVVPSKRGWSDMM